MTFKKSIFAVASMALLAACGGGGASSDGTANFITPSGQKNFDSQLKKLANMADSIDADVPSTSFPRVGHAVYKGHAAYIDVADLRDMSAEQIDNLSDAEAASLFKYTSDVNFRANLNKQTIWGKLDNFNSKAGDRITGHVDMVNGQLYDKSADADLSGRLTVNGEAKTADGYMGVDFYQKDAAAAIGEARLQVGDKELGGVIAATRTE